MINRIQEIFDFYRWCMRDKRRLDSLNACSLRAILSCEQTDNWIKSFCAFFTSIRNAYSHETCQPFINDDRAMSEAKCENVTISLPLIDGRDHGQNVLNSIEFTSILSLIHTNPNQKKTATTATAAKLSICFRLNEATLHYPSRRFICRNLHIKCTFPTAIATAMLSE